MSCFVLSYCRFSLDDNSLFDIHCNIYLKVHRTTRSNYMSYWSTVLTSVCLYFPRHLLFPISTALLIMVLTVILHISRAQKPRQLIRFGKRPFSSDRYRISSHNLPYLNVPQELLRGYVGGDMRQPAEYQSKFSLSLALLLSIMRKCTLYSLKVAALNYYLAISCFAFLLHRSLRGIRFLQR